MSREYRDRDSRDRRGGGGTRVYVGQLPDDASKEELEREFGRFGSLSSAWIARNPPGFAFIEFEDKRDAEEAVAELDGSKLCGQTVKVEIAGDRRRGGGGGRRGGFGGGGRGWGGGGGGGFRDKSNEKCFSCGGRGHFARDCRSSGGGGGGGGRGYGGGGERYGGRSYRRSRSRSRSGSPKRSSYHHSHSRSVSPKD